MTVKPPDKIFTIVESHNRKELLLKYVEALLDQSPPPELIIIVDNCSTDTTAEAIARISLKEQSISHFRLSSNIGDSGGTIDGLIDRTGIRWSPPSD